MPVIDDNLLALQDVKSAVFMTTLTLRTMVSPTAAIAAPPDLIDE